MLQLRVSEARRKTLLVPECHFAIEKQAKPFGMAERVCLLRGDKAFEGLGHAAKGQGRAADPGSGG